MKTGPAIAEILKREGVEYLFGYPVNHLIEHCAALDIRPIIVRQERIGLHMADAMSRVTKGQQDGRVLHAARPRHGERLRRRRPGVRRIGADAGASRRAIRAASPTCRRNFNSTLDHGACHQVGRAGHRRARRSPNIMRRAFSQLRNGRGGAGARRVPGRRQCRGRARAADLRAGDRAPSTVPIRRPCAKRPRCWSRPSGR